MEPATVKWILAGIISGLLSVGGVAMTNRTSIAVGDTKLDYIQKSVTRIEQYLIPAARK